MQNKRQTTLARWAPILAMALLGMLCLGATAFLSLRVDAQEQTIEDDPTAVPDPKESADNNVSFPIDI